MKKIILAILIAALPLSAKAITYSRAPSGSPLSSGSIETTISNAGAPPGNYCGSSPYYKVEMVGATQSYFSDCHAITGTYVDDFNVPAGSYQAAIRCGSFPNTNCATPNPNPSLLNDSFDVIPPPPVVLSPIESPTSTAQKTIGFVASQFGDSGLLLVILLAIGIPLTFYVIHKVIGLIPKK
jgi:hypothetical protein